MDNTQKAIIEKYHGKLINIAKYARTFASKEKKILLIKIAN